MSNIFITDIVGSIGIPGNDAQLASATTTFDGLLSGVANLTYDRVLGWVEDQAGPDGAEGVRTLNCLVEKFTYLTQECPSETQVDTLGAAIEAALEADATITTVGEQQYHLFQAGAYFLWNRDAAGGFLYPNTTTDDVAVGGHVAPQGKWFDDGDLVLGGDTMAGDERLRVIDGGARVEKSDGSSENGLYVQVSGSHPAAQQAALLDVDVNSIGLDIDSEATSKALINLQPINANTRGDIAFGVTRTADPLSPSEGDVWYNSTLHCLRWYDGTNSHCMQGKDQPGVGFRNSEWGGNADYVPITSTTWTVLGNLQFEGTNTWTPSFFSIIMSRPGTTGTVNLRLYDFTNAQVIGTIDVTASGKAYYSDTTLANLPAASAILEIQAKKSAPGDSKGYLHYWEVL
jgi:hypothetical protein